MAVIGIASPLMGDTALPGLLTMPTSTGESFM
jgi:hypothetical protein